VEKKLSTTTVSALQAKAAPAPAFSFAATMANLTKPKEAEPVLKQEDINPPETPEEKTRRVRKENRRKLRVSWKPDESLTAIKYFTHDPEEELGHDASQVRDVGDIGSEGRMLKEHRDMLDIDDDDEETSKPIEKPWRDPVLIDFSVVNQDELQRNYAPYGGGIQKPDSPESETQMLREANTLMAIYSSSADIPPTPKEAPAESTTVSTAAKNFGTPPDHILVSADITHGKIIKLILSRNVWQRSLRNRRARPPLSRPLLPQVSRHLVQSTSLLYLAYLVISQLRSHRNRRPIPLQLNRNKHNHLWISNRFSPSLQRLAP